MKKIKIISIFFIIFFLIILVKNNVYAADYNDVNSVVSSEPSSSVGKTVNFSYTALKTTNFAYCVSYGKHMRSDAYRDYRITTYVKIKGTEAETFGGNKNSNQSNAILAAILAGNLTKGHGSGVDGAHNESYNEAQQALWLYWNTWIDSSGTELGLAAWRHANNDKFGTGEATFVGSPIPGKVFPYADDYLARAISYAQQTECSVGIYFLMDTNPENFQEVILVVPENPTPPPTPNIPQYDGYIKISGKVWEDGEAGKSNDINGTFGDSSDKPLEGIRVTLKDKNGNQFVGGSTTTTDASGNYTIIVNYDTSKSVYKLYEDIDVVNRKLADGAYVEFEYDGLTYTTVATNSSGANTSKAMEDEASRINFDNSNTVIGPNANIVNKTLIATTRNVIYSLGAYSDRITENENVCTDYCNADGTHTYTDGQDSTKTHTEPANYNHDGNDKTHHIIEEGQKTVYYIDTYDAHGNVINTTGPYDEYPEGGITANQRIRTGTVRDKNEDVYCSVGHQIGFSQITNLHIQNINLGLFKREQPDIALTSDIQQVDVTMKNQKYSYVYGNKGIDSTEQFFDTKVKFQNKYTYTYKRPVNPSDVAYVNDNNTNDLQVQVIYKVILKNQSNTLPVTIRELINYYDLDYTVLECKVGNANKGNTGPAGGTNQKYYSTVFNDLNITINPQAKAELTIKYDISQTAIKGLLAQNATLNNIVEIYSFSTQYGDNTLCSEQRLASSIGRTGWAYAHYDIDSQPGNAGVFFDQANDRLDSANYQDDTDIAPSFVLEKDEDEDTHEPIYKILSGNVWEDSATESSLNNNERLGDGKKGKRDDNNSDENVLANVKVELYKVLDNNNVELAKLYKIENGTPVSYDAVTYTDSNGNYSWTGLVTDNYIIKFTYGNDNINGGTTTINGNSANIVNARNYKSTIVIDPIKSLINGSTTNDKWHILLRNNADIISVAVDDLTERNNIDSQSLIYNNFATPNNMFAYTKPFKMQVEFTDNQSSNVGEDGKPTEIPGGEFLKNLNVFNFGIIERPRENIVIDKTISNLKITLANGQVLIDGNPYTDNLDYVKALGNTITNRDVRARDKLVSIEIDTELIHGAKIDMTYAITTTNNSENDYDYTQGDSYYYYGNKGSLPLATTTIEQVVDYVDNELTVTTDGENGDWTIKDWDYLLNNGYIDPKLDPNGTNPNKIENKDYSILVTDVFKNLTSEPGNNSKTVYMHVSKLLGNQESEYTYENHTEIIQIGGKIARTIKEVREDGTQVSKEYIPGNYKPTDSSRVHEPDDDRIITRITPPTGLLDNIATYIIIGAISLLVIGIGIFIIKKRILGK